VVLAIGTELGSTDYDMYEDGGLKIPGTLIRVDIDPRQARRGLRPRWSCTAAPRWPPPHCARRCPTARPSTGARAAGRGRPDALDPMMRADLALLDAVRDTLPDALIVGDSTQATYAGNLGFAAARAGGYFNSATGFGTLGYGLPAAIGAALAEDRPVIALSGDGGLQFTLSEMASATEAGSGSSCCSTTTRAMARSSRRWWPRTSRRWASTSLPPDLPAIARACGWDVRTVATPAELAEALRTAQEADACTMLHYTDHLREAFRPG
jgi:acetolactate synthase I/II/III large subunit